MATYIGTSGFSYKDWVGPYYPPNLPQREWLTFYAQEFPACELNFSYYRMPDPNTLKRMAAKVPEGFLFILKAYQGLTHEREDNTPLFRQFVEALAPFTQAGRLGCILAQFPYSFRPTTENRDYLRALRENFGELPVVVEFRNVEWIEPETFALLRENNLGFCCVDEPHLPGLLPPIAEVTSKEAAYLRLHGRNAAKWWQHEHAWERYDYTYTDEELSDWIPKVRKMASEASNTFIFANNHRHGQAIDTARQMRRLLGDGTQMNTE